MILKILYLKNLDFVETIINPFTCEEVIKVALDEIEVKESATAPILIPLVMEKEKKKILLKNDDIRSDIIILSIINLMKIILKKDKETKNINIPIITYEIYPINC